MSSLKRTAIRNKIKLIISDYLSVLPNCKVFTARGESDGLEDFVCIYFDEGERERKHALADTDAEVIIRINTKVDPRKADDRLDEIGHLVETAMTDLPLLDGLFEVFNSAFRYSDSLSGNYSALELIYRIQYSD
jgi:hypothetical protein